MTRRQDFLMRVAAERDRAYKKHGRRQWSRHEFYAILKEEIDEVWDNIKADGPQGELYEEVIQAAAVCLGYFEMQDLLREPNGE